MAVLQNISSGNLNNNPTNNGYNNRDYNNNGPIGTIKSRNHNQGYFFNVLLYIYSSIPQFIYQLILPRSEKYPFFSY